MTFSNQYALKVDIKRRLSSVVPTFKQGDNGLLKFQIFDDGKKYDLSDYTYSEITFRLPSGQSVIGNPILEVDGVLTYNFTGVEMSEVGKVETILSIYSASTMVSVQPFTCFIYDSMKGEDLSYIGILQELIAEVQTLKQEVIDTTNLANKTLVESNKLKVELIDLNNNLNSQEQIRNNNEITRKANESSRVSEEQKRKNNETIRISSESNRVTEEQKRKNNEITREANEVTRMNSLANMNLIIDQFKSTGTYSASTQYKKYNQVEYDGNTYIAITDNINMPLSSTNTWRLLAKKGDKGDKGEKGDTGASLSVQGKLTDVSQLPSTGIAGQAYMINGELYVWSVNTSKWEYIGYIKGEKGDTGKTGKSPYEEAVENGFIGNFGQWIESLRGAKGDLGKLAKYEYTIPATSNGQTAFNIPISSLSNDDIVTIILNGINLYPITDYTISGKTVTLKQEIKDYTNTTFFVRILKNEAVNSSFNGDLLVNGTVSKDKLSPSLFYELKNKASTTELGHVKVDGKSIVVNDEGIISIKNFKSPIIYGVKIDTLNSNPETAVSYIEQSTGFTPANGNNGNFSYGSWQDKFPFNLIRPCVVKDKKVSYYLNPNDYTKKIDGSVADITSGNDGDVMVEFPKVYWKFETIGTDLYIRISDKEADEGYKSLAHEKRFETNDKIYIGAYLGYEMTGKLRSLSGKAPTVNKTLSQFRTLAQSNGAGFEQMQYFKMSLLQVLFIIMFKNRDSQSALGRGYVDGNASATATGGTNSKGMFYGENTGKFQNKFCGIEDFWGNTYYWIDGLYCDASRNILISNSDFNDTGIGYKNYGQSATTNVSGYISSVQGGTETSFIVKTANGAENLSYCDFGNTLISSIPRFGGYWARGSESGAFMLRVDYTDTTANIYMASRLTLF